MAFDRYDAAMNCQAANWRPRSREKLLPVPRRQAHRNRTSCPVVSRVRMGRSMLTFPFCPVLPRPGLLT